MVSPAAQDAPHPASAMAPSPPRAPSSSSSAYLAPATHGVSAVGSADGHAGQARAALGLGAAAASPSAPTPFYTPSATSSTGASESARPGARTWALAGPVAVSATGGSALPHAGVTPQAPGLGADAPPLHDGIALDLAYKAVFDAERNDDSGSTEAQLERAARTLPALAAGPAALLGDARRMDAGTLRRRAKAQMAVLLDASPAEKPDSASQALWRRHPWLRADGSSPMTLSELNERLAGIEQEIESERTVASHPVVRLRTLMLWHVEMDCADCMAAQARGGVETCAFWTVAWQLVSFEPPLKPDTDFAALGVGEHAPAPPEEATLIAAECAKLVGLGVLETESGPPEPGSIMSGAFVVKKLSPVLDEETRARVNDPVFVAQRGLARGTTVAERAQDIARARGLLTPSARDFERAVAEVSAPAASNRVVVDLKASGLNACMVDWPHSLPSIHDQTDWLREDDQLVLDVVKGYYAVRVARAARKFFRFRDPNTGIVYRLLRLVMGGKISGSLFCVLSGMIARRIRWLCERDGLRVAITVYIDDYLLRALRAQMDRVEAHAWAAAAAANVSFSVPKRQRGQRVSFCGAIADSDAGGQGPLLTSKPEHVFGFCQTIAIIARAAELGIRVPAWVCAHAAGLGGFIAGFIACLRPRLGAFCYAGDKYSPLMLLDAGRDGIGASATWIRARAGARGFTCHRSFSPAALANLARLFGDASGERDQGAGAMWLNEVIHRCWEAVDFRGALAAASMLKLELDPILGGFRRWGPRWLGKLVVVYVDNCGVAYCINAARAKRGTDAHKMIVELFDIADRCGFEILAVWLPRRYNAACDTISKESTLAAAAAAIRAFFPEQVLHVSAYERFALGAS